MTFLRVLRRRAGSPDAAGFTLLELMVVLSLAGILMTMAVGGFRAYAASQQLSGAATTLASTFRNAGERALSEGITYCVGIDQTASSFRVYKQACGTGTAQTSAIKSDAVLTAASFPAVSGQAYTSCTGFSACAYFYPRGTASAGTISVCRTSACTGKSYTVTIEGLSSRVSVT